MTKSGNNNGLTDIKGIMVGHYTSVEAASGVTVILCSHQMNLVEELCERIVLIDHGRAVLYGSLDEIRKSFSGHALIVQAAGPLPSLAGVERVEPVNGSFKLHLASGTQSQAVLRSLVEQNVQLDEFKIAVPTLDEIFIRVVKDQGVEQ